MNTFLNTMKDIDNFKRTENGGLTHKSTMSKILDMFAFGGAYRQRTDSEVILLFKNAYEENPLLAMKCLFYLRDIRGGQGERRFFRVCYRWLCQNHPDIAIKNLKNIAEYGRWDDLIYVAEGTPCEDKAFEIIKKQLVLDVQSTTPSLLAKWMPSQNASNKETQRLGRKLAKYLTFSSKEYRKLLSGLRAKINIVERLMSENRWDEIKFDKIPSKAGLIYRNAFARRDLIKEKYKSFAENVYTEVNADTLYPYDIAHRAFSVAWLNPQDPTRLMLQKYWDNLKDYYRGRKENGIAIIDTSGSMSISNNKIVPLEAAVSMGAYIAEKAHGPFANHFITFSSRPTLIEFNGIDIVDKFNDCRKANWGMNTNLKAVFDMLLKTAKNKSVKPEDMPTRLYIFSDMEFDECVNFDWRNNDDYGFFGGNCVESLEEANSDFEKIKIEWEKNGYQMPQVIFWNLNARNNTIPAIGEGFSYVSGYSPVMVEQILAGLDGYDLMLEKLNSERYSLITI